MAATLPCSGIQSWSSSRRVHRASPACHAVTCLDINRAVIDSILDQLLEHAPETACCCWSPTRLMYSLITPGSAPAGTAAGYSARPVYWMPRAWPVSLPQKPAISIKDIHTMVDWRSRRPDGAADPLQQHQWYPGLIPFWTRTQSSGSTNKTRHGGAEVLEPAPEQQRLQCAGCRDYYHGGCHRQQPPPGIAVCQCMLDGEYRSAGHHRGCTGRSLAASGIEQVIELPLDETEQEGFPRIHREYPG